MLAVQFEEPGPIESLLLNDVSEPVPGHGEVLVEFQASTINPADVKIRSGAIPPRAGSPPFTLGYDIVGVVTALGPGTERFTLGERVIGMSALGVTGRGTWSERVCHREESLAPAPEAIEAAVLAQLPLAGLTAHQAVEVLAAAAQERVLVVGAAGAIGRLAVQLLRRRGAVVEALVRSSGEAALLPAQTVDVVHIGGIEGASVDGVIDTVGADFSEALRVGGRYVGVVPGCLPSPDGKNVTGIITRESGAMLDALARMVEHEELQLTEPAVFGLEEVHQAHHAFEKATGQRVALVR